MTRNFETQVRLRKEKNLLGFGVILKTECGYEFYHSAQPTPYDTLIYACPIHKVMERCVKADENYQVSHARSEARGRPRLTSTEKEACHRKKWGW